MKQKRLQREQEQTRLQDIARNTKRGERINEYLKDIKKFGGKQCSKLKKKCQLHANIHEEEQIYIPPLTTMKNTKIITNRLIKKACDMATQYLQNYSFSPWKIYFKLENKRISINGKFLNHFKQAKCLLSLSVEKNCKQCLWI